jgi:hypothetical protein
MIWLTAKAPSLDLLSSNHAFCVNSWRRINPEYTIMYHNDTEAEHFSMCTKLEAKFCNAYRQMPLPIMKADMWRYAFMVLGCMPISMLKAEFRFENEELTNVDYGRAKKAISICVNGHSLLLLEIWRSRVSWT